MLETLQYIFSSPWVFIGVLVIIAVVGSTVEGIIDSIKRK